MAAAYRRGGATMQVRSRPAVKRFSTSLDLIDPGVVSLPRWRTHPGGTCQPAQPRDTAVSVYGGIARKPKLHALIAGIGLSSGVTGRRKTA